MEAVTSKNYDPTNHNRNTNSIGYNYLTYEDKLKQQGQQSQLQQGQPQGQILKYADEYLAYGRNSVKFASNFVRLRSSRSHSQPEKSHHYSNEIRSKSTDNSRELKFYEIENQQGYQKFIKNSNKKELTFYEIDRSSSNDKKEVKFDTCKEKKLPEKSVPSVNKHGRSIHQEQSKTNVISLDSQLYKSQLDVVENQVPNYYKSQNNCLMEPPKYRQFEKPPKYQESPPQTKSDPPPKYSEVTKRQEEVKRVQVRFIVSSSF